MNDEGGDQGALRRHWSTVLLAVLAYVPALTAAPGRMPADSKLYLYLDPGGFLYDAAGSFDPGQFAGWVPHQHVSYLWPAGPWFWLFDALSVPDWIAHRLWIGTLMLAAGLGVRWCSRLLGLGTPAIVTAAVVYQVALYVLPYVSRTSVMLLPWAGLGWIVGFTIRASARRTWGDPAAISLLVLTVGAVNATALAMIVPAPVLWLLHEAWRRSIAWRDALVVAIRVAVLSAGVSLWWMAALVIQGRYGAEVLPYSESLADVSFTATSAEVWRDLGYWLFYVRDSYAATTTESLRYLSSTPAIVVSFLVPVVALVGLVWVRWVHRRFAAALVVTGGVLAVGVHPVDDRSLLMRVLAGSDDGGLALALRSSTRALPVMMLGLALGAAALVDALPDRPLRRLPRLSLRCATAGAIGLLVLANLPGLWTGAFVDPALERDQDPPAAWTEAAAALDDSGTDGRVLMLPGVEFGAYRWGYTVDQPIPGLADKPLVTRDLLPLGSPAAMDLLYAFDDRFQDGVAESAALAPVARLLGADRVWLTNDVAFDRFRVARPEIVRDVVLAGDSVTDATGYGAPGINVPDVPMVDEQALSDRRVGSPVVPVELVELTGDPTVVRAHDATLLVAGSGDGLVDAAAAGLLPDGVGVRYVADDPALDGTVVGQLVTDSNRDRGRQWRSSQDTTGYTEPGGPGNGLLRDLVGDARLPVFESDDPSTQTVAEQIGPVTATATSYGEPFALLPEHRPAMAIDGDPTTAWVVGEHGDPVGETLRITGTEPLELRHVILHQPATGGRQITEIELVEHAGDGTPPISTRVELAAPSWSPDGQIVAFASPGPIDRFDLTITAVGGGEPFTAAAVAGVGFSEVDVRMGPTLEVVRPPRPAPDAPTELPTGHLFTRLRVDPLDRWRSDPEPVLVRGWATTADRTVDVSTTIRLDAEADEQTLADLFGWPVVADVRLEGSLRNVGAAAFDGDPTTAWIGPFGSTGGSIHVDRVDQPISSITVTQPITGISTITELTLTTRDESRTVTLSRDVLGSATAAIDPPLQVSDLTITVTGTELATTVDRRFGDVVTLPVAIGEIDFAGRPTVTPLDRTVLTIECVEIGVLDGEPIAATLSIADDGWLDGGPIGSRPCAETVDLPAGDHLLVGSRGPFRLDRLLLDDGVADAVTAPRRSPTVTTVGRDRFGGEFEVGRCDDGCWFVFGEGYDEGWSATAGGTALGPPTLLDGGFNGWWVESGPVTVRWEPQRAQNVAFLLSLLTAIGAIVLVVLDRRRHPVDAASPVVGPVWSWTRPEATAPGWAIVVLWALPALLLAGVVWAVLAAIGGAVAAWRREVPLAALTALSTVGVIGLAVTFLERRDAPFPGGGWPATFDSLHWLGMFAFAMLATSVLTDPD